MDVRCSMHGAFLATARVQCACGHYTSRIFSGSLPIVGEMAGCLTAIPPGELVISNHSARFAVQYNYNVQVVLQAQ